ncbi:L-glutamate gamma-semialdehyde dehydrogenase, partial [bacterium]|nr:L-glutamate gamma-semialdehyde dehydrogenase [bacterium]
MSNSIFVPPVPENEPVKGYLPGSPEKIELKAKLKELRSQTIEIPLIIGGKEVKTGDIGECRIPHDHKPLLGTYHKGGAKEVNAAAAAAKKARKNWASMPWEARAAIFLKAAELLTGRHRATLNAATMLGQSKTCFQAEIDAACEFIDFFKFNVSYMYDIMCEQPDSAPGVWNMLEQRPLDGFVFAVTPFNFTSIAGNLPTAPAMMGNTVIWKPASSSVYSAWFIMEILKEAGLPDGVINMVPGSGGQVGNPVLEHSDMAGIHFTGSTAVFQNMWQTVGNNIHRYGSYPRIVGETGGKDFIFAHPTADLEPLVTAAVRGAFEYQGQKCSAASRMYVPQSLWKKFQKRLKEEVATVTMGDPEDFRNFMGAVIDRNAFDTITGYIKLAKKAKGEARIIAGGGFDDSVGYFIEPTVIVAKDPEFVTMREEIFGPVLTIFVYEDADFLKTLRLCDKASEYALTGAIFSQDRSAIEVAKKELSHTAGNFYINDKPSGAVVGQQPFGGSRASGTNDKAGSYLNLIRWTSPRTIKETFDPPRD